VRVLDCPVQYCQTESRIVIRSVWKGANGNMHVALCMTGMSVNLQCTVIFPRAKPEILTACLLGCGTLFGEIVSDVSKDGIAFIFGVT
jgi:hypothetical protein